MSMSMQEKGRKHGTRRTTFTGADVPGRGGPSLVMSTCPYINVAVRLWMGCRPGRLCPIRLKDRKGAVREGINDMECFGGCRRVRSPGRTARSGPSGMWSRSGPASFLSPQRYCRGDLLGTSQPFDRFGESCPLGPLLNAV